MSPPRLLITVPSNSAIAPIVVTTILLYLVYLQPAVLLILLPLYFYLFTVNTDVIGKEDDDKPQHRGSKRYNKTDYPPPYPNGWYCILYSHQLAKGQVKNVKIFNQDLAVFRDNQGTVTGMDAICPHLGANMAVGGRVVDNNGKGELECPFHGWRFDSQGVCTTIPYCSEQTRKGFIRNKTYTIKEINQQILVWFTVDDTVEAYEIPVVTGLNDGQLQCYGTTSQHINCHLQEIPENGADIWHLDVVHKSFFLSFLPFKHNWQGNWYVSEEQAYIAKMELQHYTTFLGRRLSLLDIKVEAHQVGCSMVYLVWTSKFGSGVLCQSLIPAQPLRQRIIHTVWTSNYVVGLFARLFLYGEDVQVRRDIDIWNNKKFLKSPVLVKEDKLIKQFRNWYSQFYSDSSYDYVDSVNSLDW